MANRRPVRQPSDQKGRQEESEDAKDEVKVKDRGIDNRSKVEFIHCVPSRMGT